MDCTVNVVLLNLMIIRSLSIFINEEVRKKNSRLKWRKKYKTMWMWPKKYLFNKKNQKFEDFF